MAAAPAPLALDVAPADALPGWRAGEDAIDALPYVDPLADEERAKAERMVAAELANAAKGPADHLASLPPVPESRLDAHPLLVGELERVAAGTPLPPPDGARFRLDPPPPSRRGDPGAWRAALDNAHSQLEHQHNRLANLELLLQHGPRAHAAAIAHATAGATALERRAAALAADAAAVNRARKLAHDAAAGAVGDAEAQWRAAVAACGALEAACEKLGAEVAAKAAAAPAREDDNHGLPALPG